MTARNYRDRSCRQRSSRKSTGNRAPMMRGSGILVQATENHDRSQGQDRQHNAGNDVERIGLVIFATMIALDRAAKLQSRAVARPRHCPVDDERGRGPTARMSVLSPPPRSMPAALPVALMTTLFFQIIEDDVTAHARSIAVADSAVHPAPGKAPVVDIVDQRRRNTVRRVPRAEPLTPRGGSRPTAIQLLR